MRQIQEEVQRVRESLSKRHEEEKEKLQQLHREQSQSLTEEIRKQVEKEKTAEIETRFSEQVTILKRKQEDRLLDLQRAHEEESKSMEESFEKTTASLQEKVEELTSQLKSFREKMKRVEESILNRDFRKHIQDYGSPSQFWEQELESLHFVIEMRNERIHELDKKLLIMENLVEKNLALEERVKVLQQENEDLKVRMEKHQSITKQLSRDYTALQESLEKEALEIQRLHHEKEELLYQLLNGDSSNSARSSRKSFPLIAPEVMPVPT
uniref:Coiled-coil domain containing 69 n=1 Tax=Latimeria chalumnae TaxID=7897 RepID=H3BD13_LATCH